MFALLGQVSTGQFSLLGTAILLCMAATILSVARAWSERRELERFSRICLALGILCSLGVIIWHAITRGSWIPMEDNFDAFLWLATLLALFVLYVQRRRPLGGLDWFVMPIVVILLIAAAFAGDRIYHKYLTNTWFWVHRVTAYGAVIAFAIAAAAGAMYVITSRRLRSKAPVNPLFGSLERLEHLTMTAVTLGFALLTISVIMGLVNHFARKEPVSLWHIVLPLGVWFVYALIVHAPINPSIRGRKVAVLSVLGFVLMLGVVVTLSLMPGGAH